VGGTDWRKPGRPGQGWLQVPPADRRRRDPAGRRAVGRQHPRFAVARVHDRRRAGGHRPAGRPGRPRKRPAKLHGDKGYDYPACRRALRRRGITPRIARRGVEFSTRLGRHRWKVERSLAWLLANRRLTVRYERHADILTAFLHLACAPICARKLPPL
jgi:transposase